MDIHLVRVPQDVDVVNVGRKPAKWGERPALFPVHVDSYGIGLYFCNAVHKAQPFFVGIFFSIYL